MNDIAVMTRRGLVLMARSPMTVATAALMPTILLLLMSVSFGKMVMPLASLADYVQYSAPVFATMGVLFGSLSTAMAAHQDRTSGFDDRLRTLPMSPVAPLAGRIVADVARNAVTLAIITAVAFALGFRFENGFLGAVVYFALPLIVGFGVAWFMVAVAMMAESAESAVSSLNAVLLLMTFFSTGFVQREDLPGWAQPIAAANPISHIAGAMRSATTAGEPVFGSDAVVSLIWAVGLTLVFGVLATRAYRRAR
ncbi:putative multidrug ABC transporter permease protein [Gordonia araii NBRC 100433]|uniref:Transport permease protein n=1 Tax=Gordonia araii NBRC 100433 TaxID=1073574 RepID=G7GXI6_9ACTN|nr:ABC transporter permease [Gordonia araii]NNG98250.1 ABC transporter permease [Gordonia araii NBRC 100433]GAB08311.1 putative multidrug ABC transporter permease protein [Gordonia araii NBRC 100433]